MSFILSQLQKSFLTPIKSLRKRYIPLLLIYFAYGMQGIIAVALTFWEKENLSLSAEQILSITVWVSLPFTLKMLVGQMVDGVKIFGSRRKIYVFLGAGIMSLGYAVLYLMGTGSELISWMGGQFNQYLTANLLMMIGFMIQDVTADTMTTEVVDRNKSDAEIQKELALIQVLGRLSLMIAMTVVAGLGGYLASVFEYHEVFLFAFMIPVISVLGAIFVKLDLPDELGKINLKIFGSGILFGAFTVFMAFSNINYSQEIIFVVSLAIVSFMLYEMLKGQSKEILKIIIFTFIALFIFRATPSVGPVYNWWTIDELGFDPAFFGVLRQIGAMTSLFVLWVFADFISSRPVKTILILLILLTALFDIPNLMLYYGLHENFGISAQSLALFDTAVESPLLHISMIPMLSLIAFYAPAGNRATWFAVSASLMNLALTAGAIFTKYLNQMFVVTREIKNEAGEVITQADYSELGMLLWTAILIALIVPLIAVLFFLRTPRK